MSEETELQAKIAALAGQINKHKRQPPLQETARHGGAVHNDSYHPRTTSRWSPYLQGGRPNFKPIKNRTLVLANAGCDTPKGDDRDTLTSPFVTSRAGTKAELMTKETYEREQRQRREYQQQRALKSGASAPQQSSHKTCGAGSSNQAARVLEFDGIKFELQADGAKLIRVADPGLSMKETPKKVTIADVNFLRTKSGNLAPVPLDPLAEIVTILPRSPFAKNTSRKGLVQQARAVIYPTNRTTTVCQRAHISFAATAQTVHAATPMFLTKGVECKRRHVFECPEYTNHGHCEARQKGLCMLPHVDRASTLRKAAKRQGNAGSEDDSDLSSDEEEQTNANEFDDDSDLDINMGADDDSHELTQQQDYVSFAPYSRA
ncbi:hypothetical protein Slin15195_G003470 [Septoria linicola]|uniref:Uncharacterized protein n=1 Tax=Septoria linicola TaxID=215465 RepID=A0A9Q9EFB3_9PEZI|nr:hypothetical protein Slin14017_G003500 [Septoria linicola]USW47028.1 hypothetical protein Slin15195_G003470 [Septoria linicola]